MKLYEMLIPERRNDGGSYVNERAQFQHWLLVHIGGYSKCPMIAGAWRSKSGAEYYENMVPYRVFCSEEKFAEVVAEAVLTFNDQLAFMFVELGDAKIFQPAGDNG